MYDFAKEIYFDVKAPFNRNTRDRAIRKLPKPPGLKISASGISNTKFLSSEPNEICDRLKLILQEKQARNSSKII